MSEARRWSDKDPILKEALELLRVQPQETQDDLANQMLIRMQEEVAADVIEHVYEMIKRYEGKGNRWYDNDPIVLRAIEMLRLAKPKTKRIAALRLLLALEQSEELEQLEEESEDNQDE